MLFPHPPPQSTSGGASVGPLPSLCVLPFACLGQAPRLISPRNAWVISTHLSPPQPPFWFGPAPRLPHPPQTGPSQLLGLPTGWSGLARLETMTFL